MFTIFHIDFDIKIKNPAELANSTRLRGNKLFKDQKFEEALKCYSESLCLYPLGHADTSIVHSNMAAAYMSIKQLEKAKVSCDAGETCSLCQISLKF